MTMPGCPGENVLERCMKAGGGAGKVLTLRRLGTCWLAQVGACLAVLGPLAWVCSCSRELTKYYIENWVWS